MGDWGPWARAGFVLFCLSVLLMPIVIYMQMVSETNSLAMANYELCLRSIGNNFDDWKKCDAEYQQKPAMDFWPVWQGLIGGTIIASGVVWAFLWGVGLLLRWILAGRKNNHKT